MRTCVALFFVLAVIASTVEGACTNELYGTVEEGKYGYAACDISLDGYRYALCTGGVFGEDNVSNCRPRTVTIFSYGIESVSYKVGETISTITLKTDGQFTSYAINPTLPQGMTFDTTNAVIAGTPSVASPETEYTITGTPATTGAEASTTTIKVTVNAVVCAAFDSFPETANGAIAESTTGCPTGYSGTAKRTCTDGHFGDLDVTGCTQNAPSDLYYTSGGVINVSRLEHAIITPSYSGEVSSFSITPNLPAGLSISSTKGTISGVPTVLASQSTYTVTATGPTGLTTTQTVVITVTNAKCSGLASESGASVTKNHNEQIQFSCEAGYTGNWYYTCDNGVYKNKNEALCIAGKPTGFSYAKSDFSAHLGEEINTGIPTVNGVVLYYQASGLPDGFSLDPVTGIITGKSDVAVSASVTVSAIADAVYQNKAQVTITITVADVTCSGTEDLKGVDRGKSSTYKCPDGYEGEMKRTCKNVNNVGMFDLPDVHCQKVQDYTFFYICCIILAVCLVFLLIGCCVKSGRSRTKTNKQLQKQSKPAPKAAPTPAKKAAAKVTI